MTLALLSSKPVIPKVNRDSVYNYDTHQSFSRHLNTSHWLYPIERPPMNCWLLCCLVTIPWNQSSSFPSMRYALAKNINENCIQTICHCEPKPSELHVVKPIISWCAAIPTILDDDSCWHL